MRNQKETSENKRSSTKSRKKKVLETCTRCCRFISFWILKEAPNKNYSNQFICTCVCVDLSFLFFFFSSSPFVRREYFLLSKKKKLVIPLPHHFGDTIVTHQSRCWNMHMALETWRTPLLPKNSFFASLVLLCGPRPINSHRSLVRKKTWLRN